MIPGVINRMAANSCALKALAVTSATAQNTLAAAYKYFPTDRIKQLRPDHSDAPQA